MAGSVNKAPVPDDAPAAPDRVRRAANTAADSDTDDSDEGYVHYSAELLDLLCALDDEEDDPDDSATGLCEEAEDEPDRSRFYLDREFDVQYRRDNGEEGTSPPLCYESLVYDEEDSGQGACAVGDDCEDDDHNDDERRDEDEDEQGAEMEVGVEIEVEHEVEDSEESSEEDNSVYSSEEDEDEDKEEEEDDEEKEEDDEEEEEDDEEKEEDDEEEDEDDKEKDEDDEEGDNDDEDNINLPMARSGMTYKADHDPASPTLPRDLVREEALAPPEPIDTPSTPAHTPDVLVNEYEREASTPAELPHTPASPPAEATPTPRRARYVHTTPTSHYDTTDPHDLSLGAFLVNWAADGDSPKPGCESADVPPAPHKPNGDDDEDSDVPPQTATPAVIDKRPYYTPGIEHRIPQDAVQITYPVRAARTPANIAVLPNPLIAAYLASQANAPAAAAADATATETGPAEPQEDADSEEDESARFKLTPKCGFRFQHAETPQAGLSWNPGTPPCWIMVDATMYNFTRRGQLWGCGELIDPTVVIGGKVFRLPPVVLKRCQPPNMPRPRVPKPSAQFAVALSDIESSGAESASDVSLTDSSDSDSDSDYSAGDTDVSMTDSDESWLSDTTFSSATFSSTDSAGSNVSTGRMPWDWAKVALDNEFAAYVGLWDLMGIYIPTVYVWCAHGDDKQDEVVVADKAGPPIGRSWNAVDPRWKPQIVKLLNILARRGFARETLSVRHFRTMLDRPNRICLINFHDTTRHTGAVPHSRTYEKVLAALDQCRPCRSLGIPCVRQHRRRRAVVFVSKVSEPEPRLPAPLPQWVLGKVQK